MRKSLFLAVLLTGLVANAHAPKAGDVVNYSGQVGGQTQTEQYSNSGYDDQSQTWAIFHDIRGPSPDMGYDNVASVWSSAAFNDLITNCVAKNGQLQTVTVVAGTFQTCMFDDGTKQIWYGEVPIFGSVKIAYKDGSYSSELQSYTWADGGTLR